MRSSFGFLRIEDTNYQTKHLCFRSLGHFVFLFLQLNSKSNTTAVFEKMLFLEISQPLMEFDQVVVEGGEGSCQGHLETMVLARRIHE